MAKTNNAKTSNKKCTSIGGQAVLEGVMMRGNRSVATAVRDEQGVIRLETERIKPITEKSIFFRIPIIRGVLSFMSSLFGGMYYLMRSAEVYGEEEPSKFEKWLSDKLKVNVMSVISVLSLIIGLGLAIFLFMWLPQTVRGLLEKLFATNLSIWVDNLIEGGLKLTIFVLYILFCSLLKDVKRTFMYHGAEHKTISCFEQGKELTVENVKTCSRVHDRCGTTFMVFVLIISILVFACFESIVGQSVTGLLRVVCKVLLLPIVAGLSYELLKGLAKTKCFIFYPLKVPGLLLQRITTKEPDDKMIEVAIKAFTTVMEMDADPTIPEVKFVVPLKRKDLVEKVKKELLDNGIDDSSEAEWIVSIAINVKRSQLYTDDLVTADLVEKIKDIVNCRIKGRPLWYCIGDTDFCGYTIKVDERVLIPRPETELLVENALTYIDSQSKVLDLCTGSGCIAIAIQKQRDCCMTAVDISQEAINLATENASLNQAQVTFVRSDLFEGVIGNKYNVIVSNPPYIKTSDIDNLQKEVKDFEPKIALDGGESGLDFYRRIAKDCKDFLCDNGIILVEIGFDQGQQVKQLFNNFSSVEIIKDLEGKDRIIKAVL